MVNRKWVFASRNTNIFKECAEFVGSRLATGVLEIGLMGLLVNVMHLEFWLAKITVSIIVVVANYILSKLFIFRTKE
ncbi:MAG: GtrA family protein [Oscillospiraceae bacterium]|nr:GtrA family protein [Oscillospiraceae bacterium]